MKIKNFKCFASSIQSFRQGHNIGFIKILGESSAVITAGFCNVLINITQKQADSGSSMKIDLTTDEDIVKDIMTKKQLKPDNDVGELDDDFGIVPSISKARAALRTQEQFYYTK